MHLSHPLLSFSSGLPPHTHQENGARDQQVADEERIQQHAPRSAQGEQHPEPEAIDLPGRSAGAVVGSVRGGDEVPDDREDAREPADGEGGEDAVEEGCGGWYRGHIG